ncbi:uncharacterized [Tachysurus ichikawai]
MLVFNGEGHVLEIDFWSCQTQSTRGINAVHAQNHPMLSIRVDQMYCRDQGRKNDILRVYKPQEIPSQVFGIETVYEEGFRGVIYRRLVPITSTMNNSISNIV